ncbi:MAG: (Na+)-NQR maturation NqrM [Pseudomonadota bacterium]
MSTFVFAFAFMLLIMVGMALGVMLMGKTIKGSCGGLNAISDADKCVVCKKDIDPDSPLRERLQCPRARKMLRDMEAAGEPIAVSAAPSAQT